jgi:hypothetical protein
MCKKPDITLGGNFDKTFITKCPLSYTVENISCEHIEKLSDIYNVSTDYILGKSDCLSVENEEIHKLTGLNNNAIETLKFMNKNNDISTLNYIMEKTKSLTITNDKQPRTVVLGCNKSY